MLVRFHKGATLFESETLRRLAKENWQVLISTHSIDVLYELLQINKDKGDILKYKCLGREELEDR